MTTAEPHLNGDAFLESSQVLVDDHRMWDARQLLEAASRAELPNTGWPVGIVLTGDQRPTPTTRGITARVSHYGRAPWDDYWELDTHGGYFFTRRFEEDDEPVGYVSSSGHPERPMWYDLRIWRVAEVFLHSAALCAALGIPPNEPYQLSVTHRGLRGREFAVSQVGRFVRRGQLAADDVSEWAAEVTQDRIAAALPDLVSSVTAPLFALFDFAAVGPGVFQAELDAFLRNRIRG